MLGRRADPVADQYPFRADARHLSRGQASTPGRATASIGKHPILEAPTELVEAVVMEVEVKPDAERYLSETIGVARKLDDDDALIVESDAELLSASITVPPA
jgi:hypothetical protein